MEVRGGHQIGLWAGRLRGSGALRAEPLSGAVGGGWGCSRGAGMARLVEKGAGALGEGCE